MRNKNKLITNRLFFIWIQKYRKRINLRFAGTSKICECINRKLTLIFNNFMIKISNFQISLIKNKSFIRTIDYVIKKKIFNWLFNPPIKTLSVKFISFQPFSLPNSIFPVFISKHKILPKNFQTYSKKSQLENIKKGFLILNSFKGFKRLLLKQSLRDIRDLSRSLQINDKLESVIKINSFLLKLKKDKIQDTYNIFKSLYKSLSRYKSISNKFIKLIQKHELNQKRKYKIFAFTRIQNYSFNLNLLLKIQKGFKKISNNLEVKILNKLYYGFLAIHSHKPISKIYRSQLQKYPWVFRSLSQILNQKIQSNKKFVYKKLHTYINTQKVLEFTYLINLHIKSQNFKSKKISFTLLKSLNQLKNKRLNLTFIKFSSLVKKLYLKKIASAFL